LRVPNETQGTHLFVIELISQVKDLVKKVADGYARGPRKRSGAGTCHVTARETNKQRIFHDDKDRRTFPEGLRKYKSLSGSAPNAYCLMPRHLRLLLREGKESEPIDMIMRRATRRTALTR